MWKTGILACLCMVGCIEPPSDFSDTSGQEVATWDSVLDDSGVSQIDTGPVDTGTQVDSGRIELECTDPQLGIDLPERHSDADYHWRMVRMSSPVLEDAWALVIWPIKSWSAYEEGLPVVVNVLIDTVLDTDYRTGPKPLLDRNLGIVEVQALPPAWSTLDATTSGSLNYQGALSQEAVRTAILWASGQQASADGLTLSDVVERRTCGSRLVVAGHSSAGTTAVGALRPDKSTALQSVAGINLFEAPSHPQFLAREGGVPFLDQDLDRDSDKNGFNWDDARNLSYDPGDCDAETCALDYSQLRFESNVTLEEIWPDSISVRFPGVMYLDRNDNGLLDRASDGSPDLNQNGGYEEDEDFVFLGQIQASEMVRYSAELTTVAEEKGLFADTEWPTFLAQPDAAQEWWAERNLVSDLSSLIADWPSNGWGSITYSEVDHGVAISTRPHLVQPAKMLLSAGIPVQLNPPYQAAKCVFGEELLVSWTPAPEPLEWVDESVVQDWALPEELSSISMRTAGIVGLLWRSFGPIQTCRAGGE